MIDTLQIFQGKIIKVFLGQDWTFQGKMIGFDESKNHLLLESRNSQFVVRVGDIQAVCYSQSTDKYLDPDYIPEQMESDYHPTARPQDKRYESYNNYRR